MRNLTRLLPPFLGMLLVLGGTQAEAVLPRCVVVPDLPVARTSHPTVSAASDDAAGWQSIAVRVPRVVCRPVPDKGNAGGGSATQAGGSSGDRGTSRGLPFTGFDLRLLLAAGIALVVVGGCSCAAARRTTVYHH